MKSFFPSAQHNINVKGSSGSSLGAFGWEPAPLRPLPIWATRASIATNKFGNMCSHRHHARPLRPASPQTSSATTQSQILDPRNAPPSPARKTT